MRHQSLSLPAAVRGVITLAVLVGFAVIAGAGSEFRIVANLKVPATTLSRSDLARVFMKTTATWSDGTPIVPVDQDRTSAVRDVFSRAIHNLDPDAVAARWQTLVFAGRGVPPTVKKSDAEVLELVRSTPGAIGYVSADAALQGVKAITVR